MTNQIISTINKWGLTWFKNASALGGAQNMALGECKEDEITVHSQTPKFGRMWGTCTPVQLEKLIAKDHGVYEVISKFPHKLYFDLDKAGNHPEYLATALAEIEKVFPSAELVVSGSISDVTKDPSQPKFKTSYHVVAQNYIIRNDDDRKAIRLMCSHIDGFDKAVYTNNRNMKCANQSKLDGRVQAIVSGELRQHLITCFINPDALHIPVSDAVVEEVAINHTVFDLSTLPQITLPHDLDIDVLTPLEIVRAFPLTPAWTFKDSFVVLCFAVNNGVEFDDFIKWAYQKHDDVLKWKTQWRSCLPHPCCIVDEPPTPSPYRPKSIASMRQMLRHFYPNAIERDHFYHFKKTFSLPESEKVETLTQDCFADEGITCFNVGMGGGKTAQTCEYLRNRDFCWISPNIALGRNLIARTGATFYKDIPQAEKHSGIVSNKLVICMNSLRYVGRNYKTIVLDEIETIWMKWMGDFMRHKDKTWLKFVELIQSAKRVILLDAFTTTKTLDMIRAIRATPEVQQPPLRLIERLVEPKTRTVHYVRQFKNMVHKIREDLIAGRKVFIFYPQKNQTNQYISMEGLHDLFVGFKGIFYNSEVDEERKMGLASVNEAWGDLNFVITNTTITCGVNFDREDKVFDTAYIFIATYTQPRDALQVSYRPRQLTTGNIFTHFMGGMRAKEVWENDCGRIQVVDEDGTSPDNAKMAADHYRSLYKANLLELQTPVRKTFEFLCTKAGYTQTVDDSELLKETATYISQILKDHQTGYKYIGLPKISRREAEEIKEKMFNSTATQMEKYAVAHFHFLDQFRLDMRHKAEYAWDEQWIRLTRKIIDQSPLFEAIAAHNGFAGFPENLDAVKLSEPLIKEIFEKFTLKYLHEKSAPAKILMHIYNEEYGIIYDSVCENKNTTISLVDGVAEYFSFVKRATRKHECNCKVPKLGAFGCKCGGF